jgi:Flp pilus assembly protein TadG
MTISRKCRNQRGAVLVLFAVSLTAFITFVAFAIDFSNATVILNELQNAGDAGALAGAHELVDPTTMRINKDRVHELAREAAESNLKGLTGAAVKEVHIGHWSFTDRQFTAKDENEFQLTGDPDFMNNLNYINAVEVTAMRSDAYSVFAQWFLPENYQRERKAVAVVGSLNDVEFDYPLAVCSIHIKNYDPVTKKATCGTLQLVDSNVNTAGWTTFVQPCDQTSPAVHEVLQCNEKIKVTIFPLPMKCSGGENNSAYDEMRDECWLGNSALDTNGDGIPDQPWKITVPVIKCAEPKNTGSCQPPVGVLTMKVLWMTERGNPSGVPGPYPQAMNHPTSGAWPPASAPPNWIGTPSSFVEVFGIEGQQDFVKKTLYVLPDCEYEEIDTASVAGNQQIPKLVR